MAATSISINSSSSSGNNNSNSRQQQPRRLLLHLLSPFVIVLAAALICSLVALFCLYPQLLSYASSSSSSEPPQADSIRRAFACFNFFTRSRVSDDGGDKEEEELDFDSGQGGSGEPYNLFGTKTTYLNAREAIRRALTEQQQQQTKPKKPKKTKKKSSKDKKTGERFWSAATGKSKPPRHDELNDETENCSPRYFYFLNRHSIRYPSVKEIRRFRDLLPSIREQLLTGGRLPQATFRSLLSWRLLMSEVDENHVSQSGRLETAVTAQIFYQYFPSLLDIHSVHFEVGVTPKVRTTETADAFIRSLVEVQLKEKKEEEEGKGLPKDDGSLTFNGTVNDVIERKFSPWTEEKSILMTHKQCKKKLEDLNRPAPKHPPEYYRFASSAAFIRLLLGFSQRNGLRLTLSFESLVLLYRACSYEVAIHRHSPWCSLFTGAELAVLDYLMDISEYFDAYGTEAHRKLACTVVSDLHRKLTQLTSAQAASSTSTQRNATLYFSHENLLSKVISFFGLLEHFPAHRQPSDEQICLPLDRNRWRSSLLVPFGTNFAAVLYGCPATNSANGGSSGGNELEVNEPDEGAPPLRWKLLTLLNEVPVTVRGCSAPLCDLEQFLAEYEPWTVPQTCDLDAICV